MSKQEKTSLAELCRDWIKQKISTKFDYSSATNRKQDISNFISVNKGKLTQSQLKNNKIIRDSFMPILETELGNAGIDPKSLGLRVSNKKLRYNPKINATVTPDPQAGKPDSSPTGKAPVGVAPPVAGAPPVVVAPEVFDEKAVSAVFSALFLTFRMAVPDMDLLTEEEKDTLGKMWKACFNLYFSTEKWAVIGIPLIATLGIFIPKVTEGRKKGKIRKSKEEGNEKQREIDHKNELQEKNLKTTEVTEKKENLPIPFEKTVPKIGEQRNIIVVDPNVVVKPKPTLPKETKN